MPTAEEYSSDPSLKAFDNSTLSPADQAVAASYANAGSTANTSSGSSGDSSSSSSPSVISQINTTGTTGSTAGSKPSWMGNMYSQDAQGYWSTNPGNPNAERFTSDGRPVATVGYQNAQTGTHYNGYATPEQFQQIQSTIGNPQAEESLLSQWLKSGALNAGGMSPTLAGASAGGGSSLGSQLYQATQYNVSDPNFLNMPADQRLGIFQSNPALAQQELQRVKGIYNSEAGTATPQRLQDITNWANQVRQSAGIDQNDPFYGNGATPTADGSLHLTVNNQPQADVQVYKGESYSKASDLARSLGVDYKRDPRTGMPIIGGTTFNAVTMDANGEPEVPVNLVAQALGFKVGYDDTGKMITVSGNPKTAPVGGNGQGSTSPFVQPGIANTGGAGPGSTDMIFGGNQGANGAAGGSQDPTAAWNSFFNSQNLQMPTTMPIQQQFNPDWTGFYNQAHAQIDPLYQSQYNGLMSKQASDISGMDQKMNARGIFTSGIAQAAEDDLRAKTTNAVSSLFGKQMSDIAKTAQTLEQQAYKQYSDGNQFALKYNQDQLNNYLNQQKQIFSQWIQTQKLSLSQLQYALNSRDKMATMTWNQYKFNNLSADQKAQLDWKQTTFNNLSADQQATLDQKYQQMLLPYNNMTQYQQSDIALKQQAQQMSDYFKQQGLNISAGQLEEAIRSHQANEQNQSDSLKLRMYDMMGYDQNGTPTMKRDQLNQTIAHDNQLVDIARTNATNGENRTVIDGIGKQLSAVNGQINALYNSGVGVTDKNQLAQIQAQVKTLSDQRDTYLNQLKQYTSQGFYNSNFPGASQ